MTFTGKFVLVFFYKHSRFTGQQKKEKGICLTPHYHFHSLHRHLDIIRTITLERLPLHIASSQTQTGNLVYTYAYMILCIYIAYIYIYIHIIHSAMETWKYAIIRNFNFLSLCPFSKVSHPFWLRASYATAHSAKILPIKCIKFKNDVFDTGNINWTLKVQDWQMVWLSFT